MLSYVKRLNEIEISFYNIARFITVTLKISSGAQGQVIKKSIYKQLTHTTLFQGSH